MCLDGKVNLAQGDDLFTWIGVLNCQETGLLRHQNSFKFLFCTAADTDHFREVKEMILCLLVILRINILALGNQNRHGLAYLQHAQALPFCATCDANHFARVRKMIGCLGPFWVQAILATSPTYRFGSSQDS